MEYQLRKPLLPQRDFEKLSVVERVLINRGIKLEEVSHYLNTTDEDILNPEIIPNIKEGVQMLVKHIHQGNKIYLQIDSDCDGFTSAALFINYINSIFPGFAQNNIYYMVHSGKQHGIDIQTIPKDVKLIVAPDSSSNEYEKHKMLKEKGYDILVIDHHEADKYSENACVINNQLCNYPTKSLSGVGMVYKFCQYIDKMLGINNADNFLDLVAIGLIGDMMDLRDFETKHLVFKGLNQLRNPFIKAIREVQRYSIDKNGGLNPYTVSFYISPAINAVVRVGTMDEKLLLFESMLDFMGYELIPSTKRGCKGKYEPRVEQACRNCNNIRNKQNKLRDAGTEFIEKLIEVKELDKNKIILVALNSGEIHPNLTGLIANRIMAEYNHPTLLMIKKPDKETGEILLEGSGRGYTSEDFDDLRQYLKDSNLFYLAEGHPQALGVGMLYSDLSKFITKSNQELSHCEFYPCEKVDFIWDSNDFKPNDISSLSVFNGIHGQGVELPKLVLRYVKVSRDNMKLENRGVLKITLPNGVELIRFNTTEADLEELLPEDKSEVVIDILGHCDVNKWMGMCRPQIIVEDFESSLSKGWSSYF